MGVCTNFPIFFTKQALAGTSCGVVGLTCVFMSVMFLQQVDENLCHQLAQTAAHAAGLTRTN